MKREDFNRLKEICEKEGFYIEAFNGLFAIKEKDIWEGVEYGVYTNESGEYFTKGKIYPFDIDFTTTFSDNGRTHGVSKNWVKLKFQPSTECAYIEQLKKNAFEKFGEIKEGDRFINPNGIKVNAQSGKFEYHKEIDSLFCGLALIYQQGKWAEKLPEMVKVEFFDYNSVGSKYNFKFNITGEFPNLHHLGDDLAIRIEKYLNKQL